MNAIKNILLLFIVFFSKDLSYAQTPNPFLALQADSIVIYDFEWRGITSEYFSIIDKEGRLASTVKKSTRLDPKESEKLSALLVRKTSYGQSTAACFEPHLGVVYFKTGKPVAHVTICVSCNRLESSVRIAAQEQGKMGEGDIVSYTLKGMSKNFRKYLDNLLKKYNFSHGVSPGSMFD